MRVYNLVGKKGGKWESIAVGEDYGTYRDMFFSLAQGGNGYEAVIFMDNNIGTLKVKRFGGEAKPAAAEKASEPAEKKTFGHKRKA